MSIETPEYKAWKAMKRSCSMAGLEISPVMGQFKPFLAEVGQRPAKGYRLMRNDQALGMVPGNVAWNQFSRVGGSACPYAYAAWSGLRYSCLAKGLPVSPEFDRFDGFLAAFGRRPSDEHRLARKVVLNGFTKKNVAWCRKGESIRKKAKPPAKKSRKTKKSATNPRSKKA